ncbi:hypothetical protein [Moheibacter sediminis]|uniref:Uncharacterized protein n=1 Tax=Moheibacter sediminis TaxID=1434700 RepID=A0A1W2ADG1_9FLAO|nr:hypothetical protein [Moheibacter sediminis]SMC58759.1 hypothetical protein SAMN06296427_10480 [Moheibacter sediminis]
MRKLTFLFLFGFSLILNSCSYLTHFFILNKSEQDLEISIEFMHPIERIRKQKVTDFFKYTDQVLKINNKTLEKLDENLEYKTIDNNTIQITTPKRSTVFISRQNIEKTQIKSITINDVIYSKEEFEKKIRKGGGFHNYYYSIKE